ncbi:MAG TPA: FecR domain-containing protein [Victivallales bacterium]|nr:FecR domain-containing protein [Victivallales bacterium]HRR06164.1 FecR domain-containing protein [Victivallales bacterium]
MQKIELKNIENITRSWLDGELDEKAKVDFLHFLEESPEALKEFRELLQVEGLLRAEFRSGQEKDNLVKRIKLTLIPNSIKKKTQKLIIRKILEKNAQKMKNKSKKGNNNAKNFIRKQASEDKYISFWISIAALFVIISGVIYLKFFNNSQNYKIQTKSSLIPKLEKIADIRKKEGKVVVLRNGRFITDDSTLYSGDTIITYSDANLYLKMNDQTELNIMEKSKLSLHVSGGMTTIFFTEGGVLAKVAKQENGKTIIFSSKIAEVKVIGTMLEFYVSRNETKINMIEGKVMFTNLKDKKSTLIEEGYLCIVKADGTLLFRSLVDETIPRLLR